MTSLVKRTMMDNAITSAQKNGCTKDNLDLQNFRDGGVESAEENCFSKSLVRGIKPEDILLLDIDKSKFNEFCIQKLFLQHNSSSGKRIPRQITSLDEIYLRQCMELIHISALRAGSPNNLSEIDSTRFISTGSGQDNSFIFASGNENVFVGPTGDSVLGTITGSTSMMNILNSPLFRQLGISDNADKSGRTGLLDFRETSNSSVASSSGDFCIWPPHKIEKNKGISGNRKFGHGNAHKRFVSISSSSNSTFSSESSSFTSTSFSQGMLHCSWNNGFPHYEFTVDDQRETYIANLSKVELSGVKVSDYVYTFYSRSGGKKGDAIHEKVSDLVGKMRVSTSFTLCPNNMEIMETQFVLSASSDNFLAEMQTSGDMLRKSKGLSKKMGETFRSRQITFSKLRGSNAIPESSFEPYENSSSGASPNLELAAIIVKSHTRQDFSKKVVIGGWGLKFLKSKENNSRPNTFSGPTSPCECCQQDKGDCSTSMDILVPAGFHGGPRTSNGGPASLIERWRGNGRCDCGGWDIGCPLTLLKTKPSNKDVFSQVDVPGIDSFDLFVQGSTQNAAMVKITSIQDGLYYVQYQSGLSALQCLSIAVAIIHSRSPTLRPKSYRS